LKSSDFRDRERNKISLKEKRLEIPRVEDRSVVVHGRSTKFGLEMDDISAMMDLQDTETARKARGISRRSLKEDDGGCLASVIDAMKQV